METTRGRTSTLGALSIVLVLLVVPGATPSAWAHDGRSTAPAPDPSISPAAVAPGASATGAANWTEFHGNPGLTGVAPASRLSVSTASRLGVRWATNLYGAALDSPVVEFDPLLGQNLAYIGTESGNVLAVRATDGQIVWGDWLGSPIRATLLVAGGAVFVGTFTNPAIFKLNATTGATECSIVAPRPIEGSPTFASPPGGVPTVYFGTEDATNFQGPVLAVETSNCSIEWSFSSYPMAAGVWVPLSYGTTASGTPEVIFGTADPDSGVYALNAVTGALIWRFQAVNPPPGDYDIGAGAVISLPGVNGFSQGVAYIPTKFGLMYALALNNGTLLWTSNFDQLVGVANGTDGGRSTAALAGANLVLGSPLGLVDLSPKTGALIWARSDPAATETISSPAVVGRPGSAIVVAGDVAGAVDVVALSNGTPLYTYQTGGYVTASPAVAGGLLLISSTDGFLYAFGVGGDNDPTLPATTLTTPAQSATLPNPNGNLTLQGNATDPDGVRAVEVAIESGGTGGSWWDATTATWVSGPFANLAALSHPGRNASGWTLSFPVEKAGGTFEVSATAISVRGEADRTGAHVGFQVSYSTLGPHLQASPAFVPPGWGTTVNGGGFTPGENVTLSLLGTPIATLVASASGALPATRVTVPGATPFGVASLVATGDSSGRTTSVAITVANSWGQLGYDAGHTGYEPDDPVLNDLVYPGHNEWIRLAWHFQAAAPINASPVIADGVAYVADSAGDLYAVDTANGGLLWTWTLPSGHAIKSTPAVNGTAGLVFVGSVDGTLSAVSTSTGITAWTAPVGGSLTPPTFAGGAVYIASSSGAVDAFDQKNGTRLWTTTVPGGVDGAPALNLSAGLLVVGTLGGNVTELDAATGAPMWSFAAGGTVKTAVIDSAGVIYFGSTNGIVYALRQSDGSEIWSFATGGPVTDTGALSSHYTGGALVLLIGSDDGHLYEIYAGSGLLDVRMNLSASIKGVAAVEGIVVIEGYSGLIGAARTYADIVTMRDQTGQQLLTSPAIVDSTLYVAGGDGFLDAFTTFGQMPD